MIDEQDCIELMQLEELIEEITDKLNSSITVECNLEIILLGELDLFPEIRDTLSLKNKFIKLRQIKPAVKNWVDGWIKAEAEIRQLTHKKKQVEGKRDSKKKVFAITPR